LLDGGLRPVFNGHNWHVVPSMFISNSIIHWLYIYKYICIYIYTIKSPYFTAFVSPFQWRCFLLARVWVKVHDWKSRREAM
jgi:hypothetical protein